MRKYFLMIFVLSAFCGKEVCAKTQTYQCGPSTADLKIEFGMNQKLNAFFLNGKIKKRGISVLGGFSMDSLGVDSDTGCSGGSNCGTYDAWQAINFFGDEEYLVVKIDARHFLCQRSG